MLEVRQLAKRIGRQEIFSDITFSLQPGTITGLIGRNGAGKTTLLRTMVGILRADRGAVWLDGVDLERVPRQKAEIVMIPHGRLPYSGTTVRQLADLYAAVYPKFDRAGFEAGLVRFMLPAKADTRTLSKGMAAMVGLLLALHSGARYLLLDEPIDGLDPISKRQCLRQIVETVAERGATVLIASHRLAELETVCDAVLMMRDGRISNETELREMQRKYTKLQVAYHEPDLAALQALPGVRVLERTGRIVTVLVEAPQADAVDRLQETEPLLIDPLPLRLEDLFIAEFGGDVDAAPAAQGAVV